MNKRTGLIALLLLFTSFFGFLPDQSWAAEEAGGMAQGRIDGLAVVEPGQTFETTYSLEGSTGPVLVQDIRISFNPDQAELLRVEPNDTNWIIAGQLESSNEIRLLVANDIAENEASGDSNTSLILHWKATNDMVPGVPDISVAGVEVSQGNNEGAMLRSFAAAATMNGDLNSDGRVSIGDLALVVKALGKTAADPEWDQFMKTDLNQDGMVDNLDLRIMAELILRGDIAPPVATWTGPVTAAAGDTVVLTFGIHNLYQHVYAQDLLVAYNKDALTFVGAASTDEAHVKLVEYQETEQGVRLLTALTNTEDPAANADYLRLTFTVKEDTHARAAEVSVQSLTVADGAGVETEIAGAAHTITLETTTDQATGDMNEDDRFTIGDLAILASHYGVSSADPNWQTAKQGDLNDDGKVDLSDLSLLATKILGQN